MKTAQEVELPGRDSFAAEPRPSDAADLLKRAQAGDAEAFCELCRVHENRLFRQALTLCGDELRAEELAQDALVEAWRALPRYRGGCQLFTWLCAILFNRFRNELRGKRHSPLLASPSGTETGRSALEQVPAPEIRPDQAAQMRERAEMVWHCVQALSAKHQQVIYLRFYSDDSLEGIAAALGCSVGTVKSRLFHALERLRRMNELGAPGARLETKVGIV